MALSILNNIPSLVAQNNLSITNANLQKTLFRLSSGSRINSGADDAAGVDTAIANVAGIRGSIGAGINRLQSAVNVINHQVQNLTSAEDGIPAADIPSEVANLSRFTILNQAGLSSLAQANPAQQSVLTLLR